MRLLAFLVLAAALTVYAFWVYLRVELPVPVARRLAVVRALALVVVLLLLFDPRLPVDSVGAAPARWALLDASVSMSAVSPDGTTPWVGAAARAAALERDGWRVVRFGGPELEPGAPEDGDAPEGRASRLLPALESAAESGARDVHVLSDLRFEDAVALRAAAERLPLRLTFEAFGGPSGDRGIADFEVPDVPRPEEAPVARVEVFGGSAGDSLEVVIFEEAFEVARATIAAPSPGLRAAAEVALPPAGSEGRVRYRVALADAGGDGFPDDDEAVTWASVGFREGGLVLVSFRPDWEPRYLLPVLRDVTGLTATGYLRAGPDRFVVSGRAADRGGPVDSTTVRRAASDAELLVVHGLGADAEAWIDPIVSGPGRRLVLPVDAAGAGRAGVEAEEPRPGEWYASPDVPTSPVAGALTGVPLQGLPPLDDVMTAATPNPQPVLQLQLRGAGAPTNGFHLVDAQDGRRVVALASSTWRWATRPEGQAAYRGLWSGLAGWLLSGERAAGAVPRPTAWVVEAGTPVTWSLPGDSASYRISVAESGEPVADTVLPAGGAVSGPTLPAGSYDYAVADEAGDTVATGRFDVARSTLDMLWEPIDTSAVVTGTAAGFVAPDAGRPLRTSPLPYLLVIALLCGEWVVRRRSGLR